MLSCIILNRRSLYLFWHSNLLKSIQYHALVLSRMFFEDHRETYLILLLFSPRLGHGHLLMLCYEIFVWVWLYIFSHSAIYLFHIYGLLWDATTVSDCTTLNSRVVGWWRSGKNLGMAVSRWGTSQEFVIENWEKSRIICQDSWCRGRNSK